jgi:hypothetical protein
MLFTLFVNRKYVMIESEKWYPLNALVCTSGDLQRKLELIAIDLFLALENLEVLQVPWFV